MPVVKQVLPDGTIEEFFYADPVAVQQHTKHESVEVDGGVIKMDGDLSEPLVIKKTLTDADKYIRCTTDGGADQFTVSGVGEVRCQDVGCLEAEFTQGVSIGASSDVAVINSTGLHLHKNLVISAYNGVGAPPTFYTSGTVAAVKDGQFAFVPYDDAGNQIPGHVYKFGRQTEIGDVTHDNDGMLMRKTAVDQDDGSTKPHLVHISPDPTDPNLLISSKKHYNKDGFVYDGAYIRCQKTGPHEPASVDDVVFEVDNNGRINSKQITDMASMGFEALSQTDVLHDNYDLLFKKIHEEINPIAQSNMSSIANNAVDIETNINSITALGSQQATNTAAIAQNVIDIANAGSSSPTYTVYDFTDNPVRLRDHDASNSSYSNPIEYTANGAHTKIIIETSHQWKQGSEAIQTILVENSSLTANSIVKVYFTLQTNGDTDYRAVSFSYHHLQIDNVQRVHLHLMHKNFSSIEYDSNGNHFEDGDWWTNAHLAAGSHFIFHIDVIEPGT